MPVRAAQFYCHNLRAAPGILFFRVLTKDNEYSTKWRKNIVAVITRDRVIDSNFKRKIKNRILRLASYIILKKK